jgi:hypothetical protein
MNYRDEWLHAMTGKTCPSEEIEVRWANGQKATYTMKSLEALKEDPACMEIMNMETGEILFYR